ncbi:putative DNA-binding transcriptional regulator YafY [Paenibacillus taihuensis]|uniref:Putative DNA-binding transcriptional regulator YafY n=1 Tax=Paenibacillus taihuensis TaxID=1156355 RepID=A0A3D9SD58_9BACL|nr:HTH domain-containing protein [Paenibacillus taihuensis]REE88951.1 putative DNA-binding transcriptional regulator YafY [Paenibacillus taihuensis]
MRADRLIMMTLLLQTEGRLTAKELAKRLEVSERTIYRDIDALSAAGIPVYAEPGNGGGISLPPEYRTRADDLTSSEVQALFVQHASQTMEQLGIGSSFRSGLLKIMNALPTRHKVDAEWIRDRVFLDTEAWRPRDPQVDFLQLVQQAVWEQRAALLVYQSKDGALFEARVEPHGLVAKGGIWFMVASVGAEVGESEVNRRMLPFRLTRIQSFTLLEERFDRQTEFDLVQFWRKWVERFQSTYFMPEG